MRLLTTVADTQRALDKEREAGRTVGFVPTMGFLHDGHSSLIARARAERDVVAVSIFVNPLQFGPTEDLEAYPRDLDADLERCERDGTDIVFHPSAHEMYPEGRSVTVGVGDIGQKLCGRTRPGHFDGVATVVAKLFNIAGACTAYFGEKDAQQLVVIRRLARALDFPVTVVGCSTVREPDGLAMSSRNLYLDPDDRAAAVVLKRALDDAVAAIKGGERSARSVAGGMASVIGSEARARLDYAACVDPITLEDLERIDGAALLAVAAFIGKARLIDNSTVTLRAPSEGS